VQKAGAPSASIREKHNRCNKRAVLATEYPIASMEIYQKTELLSKQAGTLNVVLVAKSFPLSSSLFHEASKV
jgi:hypothetical protein